MREKSPLFTPLILAVWALIMCLAVAFSLTSVKQTISPAYDTMVDAANIARQAMDEVKQEKLRRGIAISEDDILETGMIGEYYSSIVTTVGVLEAKRTTVNPNWAAVVVGMFRRANLRSGDHIATVFSGSFPALNICVMAAAQAYGLKQCVMASVGSSYYGATCEQFTFFDMAEHLYSKDILKHRIDYVSLGGDSDVGNNFFDDGVKEEIMSRIKASGVTFIYEQDYVKNIDMRIAYLNEDVPNVKFVINVGGGIVGLGTGANAFVQTGYVEPRFTNSSKVTLWGRDNDCGLLQYYLAQGIPVASLLNIKGLALTYGVPYDPVERQQIGVGQMYYSNEYSPVIPSIAIALSIGIGVFFFIYCKRGIVKESKDERNYILYRR